MKIFIMLIFFLIFFTFIVNGKEIKGFTVDLIHRNSLEFYNASTTLEDQANDTINGFKSYYSQRKFQSTVFPNGGGYLMRYSVGTPALEQFAVLDTGSSLVWLQCHPCVNCYTQGSPNFYPFHSSSYRRILCSSEDCHAFDRTTCGGPMNNQCLYEAIYGDRSFSRGEMATDTLTFGYDASQVVFPNIIVGCGYNNTIIGTSVASGVIGLGRGPSSLNSQLRNILQERFSYCLVPPEISGSNSKLRFGEDDGFTSGATFVSTPLLSHDDDGFYYLRLEGITIGNNRIQNHDPTLGGNMIIDSGTTATILKQRLYTDLEAIVRGMINLNAFPYESWRLCYQTESFRRRVGDMKMIFHFAGGADITLGKTNIFFDGGLGVTCFAIIPPVPNDPNSYFGNRAQINFHVQYDVANSRISFAPTDCTSFS